MAEANGSAVSEGAGAGEGTGGQPDIVVDDQPWHTTLTDEGMRENPALTRYKTIDDFAKGHLELEKKFGERPNGIQAPGEDATPEDWAAFYKQLPGYPDAADKYEVAPPSAPAGLEIIDEEGFKGFLETMHSSGATKPVVDAAVRWFEKYQSGMYAQAEEADNAATHAASEALRQEWGPEYDYRLAVALEGMSRDNNGDLSWADAVLSTGPDGTKNLMGNSPQFLKAMYELAKFKQHDRFVTGAPGGPASVDAAKQQMDQARVDLREGRITQGDFDQLQERLAPLVYGRDDGLVMGSMTGIDLSEEET